MGNRTVVILNNDLCHEWESDPFLGQKIAEAMNKAGQDGSQFHGGRVVECTHTSTQTLAIFDYLSMAPLSHSDSHSNHRLSPERELRLMALAADKLGYKLIRKPQPRKREFKQIDSTGQLPNHYGFNK